MKILVADDDALSRHLLRRTLQRWGHPVVVAADGSEAWRELTQPDPPDLAVVDWMMPGLNGVDLCRVARCLPQRPLYIILLTVRRGRENAIVGLEAGADDYIVKPFDAADLRARLHAGMRVIEQQRGLTGRIAELEMTLARTDGVSKPLPICSHCRRVRDEDDSWHPLEAYVTARFDLKLSHGLCPPCAEATVRGDLGGQAGVSRPPRRVPQP